MKEIVLGVVGMLFVYVIVWIANGKKNVDNLKRDWERNSHKKKIEKLDSKISQIRILKHQDIIEEVNAERKILEIEEEKKSLRIEYYLTQNDRYKTLQRSLEKGFIDTNQFNVKVSEIRERIKSNIK